MEKEHYIQALSRLQELPVGFSNYLEIALEKFHFDKDRIVEPAQLKQLYIPYLIEGLAMLCTENLTTKAINPIEFYVNGDFLPALPATVGECYRQKIVFLEETTLLGLREKHYTFLPKIFITTSLIYQKIGALTLSYQLKKEVINRIKPAHQRLAALQQWRPQLSGRIPENYLESYLSMRVDDQSSR